MISAELQAWLAETGLTREDVGARFDALTVRMRSEVDAVRAEGSSAWPVVDFESVAAGPVDTSTRDRIRRRGCVVVRGTFPRSVARRWDAEVADYLTTNHFEQAFAETYPDASDPPRIWGVYWSPAQVAARQHPRMATVRRFLNSFWRCDPHERTWFEPDRDIGYPDRLRRRAPGIVAAGLPPHCDGVVSGGWRVEENAQIFRHVLAGAIDRYDPWDATDRVDVGHGGVAPSSVFRTFQGWTALSEMHPDDGVLHAIPIPAAAAYMYVRGIAGELGLSGGEAEAAPRRFRADDLLYGALVPIPRVEPGDTVWWHADVIHSVAAASNDVRWGNVMYIASTPGCPRNDDYRASMLERFVSGRSPLDFPAEDFEVDFVGRPTVDDLSPIGRGHFGLTGVRSLT